MPPVRPLDSHDAVASSAGATRGFHRKITPVREQDRRAEHGRSDGAWTLARPAIGKVYPPAAATLFLVIETATVFAIGWTLASLFGFGTAQGEFGPRLLFLVMAAILFAVATILQGTFVGRPPRMAAMWGMRLVAPLAIAELVAVTAFTGFYPNLPLSPTVPAQHWISSWFIMSYLAGGALNTIFETAIRHWEAAGRLARRIVVFGGGSHGRRFIEALMHDPDGGLRIDAFFDDRTKTIPDRIGDVPFAGTAEDLIQFTRTNPVDEVVIALPWAADKRILDILRKFRALPLPIRLAPDSSLLFASLGTSDRDTVPAPVIQRQPLSPWGLFLKDMTDRMLSAVALIGFAPLLVAVAIAVKLTSRGSVFFRQPRLGFNNRPFRVFKFRTMRNDGGGNAGLNQATRHDPRVTPVGAFLRRWSLDELPQILNVLKGDMSLVGPRPHPLWRQASDLWQESGDEPLEAIIHEYAARHRVKPGITGWAQVSGFRGETATVDRMRQRIEYDIDYIDHWSLWFDFKIMFLTVLAVFKTGDVY